MPEIRDVLLSVEARQFWERVYIEVVRNPETFDRGFTIHPAKIADSALRDWRERFEKPEGGE